MLTLRLPRGKHLPKWKLKESREILRFTQDDDSPFVEIS